MAYALEMQGMMWRFVLVGSFVGCGPGEVVTGGGTGESSSGGSSGVGETGGPTSTTNVPTSTSVGEGSTSGTSVGEESSGTATTGSSGGSEGSSGAVISTSSSSSSSTTSSSTSGIESSGESSEGGGQSTDETTGEPCGEDEAVCAFSSVKLCDGMGGFKAEVKCNQLADGGTCVEGIGCVSDCEEGFVMPGCPSGYPRIMLIVDASSSMLNLQAGLVRAEEGQGGWEQVRDVIAGFESLFDIPVQGGLLEERAYVGLTTFGNNVPDESKLVAQYGPCHRDVLRWGLDPATSCVAPGCTDPYADGPISWTFVDGAWAFGEPVISHMPTCNKGNAPNKGCFGSGTYVHTGLVRVQQNLAAYKAACANDPEEPCDAGTQFVNLLIFDGAPNSTEAEYKAPLTAMFDQGVVTHVIGFGDGVDAPNTITTLNKIAGYGSGGALTYYNANNQAELEQAILQAVLTIDFSGC